MLNKFVIKCDHLCKNSHVSSVFHTDSKSFTHFLKSDLNREKDVDRSTLCPVPLHRSMPATSISFSKPAIPTNSTLTTHATTAPVSTDTAPIIPTTTAPTTIATVLTAPTTTATAFTAPASIAEFEVIISRELLIFDNEDERETSVPNDLIQ